MAGQSFQNRVKNKCRRNWFFRLCLRFRKSWHFLKGVVATVTKPKKFWKSGQNWPSNGHLFNWWNFTYVATLDPYILAICDPISDFLQICHQCNNVFQWWKFEKDRKIAVLRREISQRGVPRRFSGEIIFLSPVFPNSLCKVYKPIHFLKGL